MPNKTVTYGIVQKDNDQLGTDIWRDKNISVPMAYRPTVVHTSRANANGSNINQTIDSFVPLVRLVDGLSVSTDAFKATFKFSALQHVVNDEERAQAFDALLAYLTAHRSSIIAGQKSLATTDWTATVVLP